MVCYSLSQLRPTEQHIWVAESTVILTVLEAGNFKMRARLSLGEHFLPGLQRATFSLHPHVVCH